MTLITRQLIFALLVTLSLSTHAGTNAEWMRANWGIRVVIPAGNNDFVNKFSPERLVQQLAEIKTAEWVIINATQGGYGGYLTTNNTKLNHDIDLSMTPSRDILQECVDLLRENGYRVIVYFAAEGPLGLHPEKNSQDVRTEILKMRDKNKSIREGWTGFLRKDNMSNHEAIAAHILQPIAHKLGPKADGWWFDHGKWGDAKKLAETVKKYNPNTAIAWNEKHAMISLRGNKAAIPAVKIWGLKRSNEYEDYTAGHVTPPERIAPWSDANDIVVQQIEKTTSTANRTLDGLVPHWLIPIQSNWRRGEADFPTEKAINWTSRIIQSNGAITWAVALEQPEFTSSEIAKPQFQQLKDLDEYLLKKGLASPR